MMREQTDENVQEQSENPAGNRRSFRHRTFAWVLITLGTLLILGNLLHIGGGIFLIVLGGAFLAGYLSSRNYGLLIPAMILIGLGIGVSLGELELFGFEDYWVPFCLGLGFVAIFLVDRTTWSQSTRWPLWPACFLVLVSVWGTAYEAGWIHDLWWEFEGVLKRWWPILLILWGVILLQKRKKVDKPDEADKTDLAS